METDKYKKVIKNAQHACSRTYQLISKHAQTHSITCILLIKTEPHSKCSVRTILTCGTQAKPWWRVGHQNRAMRGNGTASLCEFHLS